MYVDYWKAGSEISRKITIRNIHTFALPGLFCLLWASKRQIRAIWRGLRLPVTARTRRERHGWRVRFRPVPTPRRIWSRKSHHPAFKPCTREEDRFALRVVPIKRNFLANGQTLCDRIELKDAAFEAARCSTTILHLAGKRSCCFLHSDWAPLNNSLFKIQRLKLQSEVEVEYFDQNDCQTSRYSYKENNNTNMWKEVNVESFLCLVLPSVRIQGETKAVCIAVIVTPSHVTSAQSKHVFVYPFQVLTSLST